MARGIVLADSTEATLTLRHIMRTDTLDAIEQIGMIFIPEKTPSTDDKELRQRHIRHGRPLWDAVDSTAGVERHHSRNKARRAVTRRQLCELMGTPLESILHNLLDGSDVDPEDFLRRLLDNECRMMPELGGRLYEGVRPTLQRLHDSGTRLFMVSNCGPDGLTNFPCIHRTGDFFTETLSFGATGVEKDVNIRRLVCLL